MQAELAAKDAEIAQWKAAAESEALFANEANAQVAEFEADNARKDAEIARLREEREDALKLCRELTEPKLKRLHYEDGRTEMTLQSAQELVCDFAETLLEIFLTTGGMNVVEFTVVHPKEGPFTLSLQKQRGKTALTLKAEAEAERDAAQAENRRLREALGPFAAQWMDPPNLPPLVQEDFRRAAKAMEGE
jgi:DNA-directed RNA polymerase subunit L